MRARPSKSEDQGETGGKYVNLDFAQLKLLAPLDHQLRGAHAYVARATLRHRSSSTHSAKPMKLS